MSSQNIFFNQTDKKDLDEWWPTAFVIGIPNWFGILEELRFRIRWSKIFAYNLSIYFYLCKYNYVLGRKRYDFRELFFFVIKAFKNSQKCIKNWKIDITKPMHESTQTIMKLHLIFQNRALSQKDFKYRTDSNRNTSLLNVWMSFEYFTLVIESF